MKTLFYAWFALASALASLAGDPVSQVDQYVSQVAAESPYPGLAVVLVVNDRIAYSKGFGVIRQGQPGPVTADTPLAIGSLTKSFTALALLQMAEQGLVDLHAPITTYLPWFQTAVKEKSDRITLAMLLSNSSGIPSMDVSIDSRVTDDLADERLARSLNAYLLNREPGSSFEYSNEGFALAGLIGKVVSGKPFHAYLQSQVLTPLNMAQSSSDAALRERWGNSHGHYPGLAAGIPAESSLESSAYQAAGSLLRCSANDLGNYLITLLNEGRFQGRQVMSPETITALWSPHIPMPETTDPDRNLAYGFGWMLAEVDGRPVIHHGGATGTMTSFAILEPQRKTGVAVICNIASMDSRRFTSLSELSNNMLHLYHGEPLSDYGRNTEIDKTQNTFDLAEGDKDQYLGTYTPNNLSHYVVVIRRNDEDALIASEFDGQVLVGESFLDFLNPSRAILRNIGGSRVAAFQLNLKGEVFGLKMRGQTLSRAKTSTQEDSQAVTALEGRLNLRIPQTWSFAPTATGFLAQADDRAHSLITGSLPNSAVEEVFAHLNASLTEAPSIVREQTYNARVWKEQVLRYTREGKPHQALFMTTADNDKHFYLFFETADGQLTLGVQDVFFPIFKSLTLR